MSTIILYGHDEKELELNRVLSSSIGEGWHPLVRDLVDDLIAIGWDRKVLQIKEKFGGLRFYIPAPWRGAAEINARILQAENLAEETCEVTGKPGSLRHDLPWIRTLCDDEYQKAKDREKVRA